MRVFVTGGTGFIGKPLVRELRKRKHTVKLLAHDLELLDAIEKDLISFKPNAVIHLAWEGIPNLSAKKSRKNQEMSIQFLKLLAALKIKKVIVAGTCWQHGGADKKHAVFVRAKNAIRDKGKKIIEHGGGIFIWTYPFFVYGPGKRSGSLISSLINDAKKGKIPTPKEAQARHDFVYVEDVARAFCTILEKTTESSECDIGSGVLTQTAYIAQHIAHAFKLPIIKVPTSHTAEQKARLTALKRFGWRPHIDIRAGVSKTIQSQR